MSLLHAGRAAGAHHDDHRAPAGATPDQVVQFRFRGRVPGQIDPSGGITFGCRVDGGSFRPCTSPYTTARLALAEHRFEVRAVSAAGAVEPTPAGFAFRVTQPRAEVRRHVCALRPVGAYHDRGTRDWGPCDFPEIVCPRAAACLLDLTVDEHDESYLFNYDVHLQRHEEYAPGRFAYRDKVLLLRAAALDAGQPEARGALRPAPR